MRDYYEVLDIPFSASSDDVKKAYRKLALQWHPDKHPPERQEEATSRFREIHNAYSVLSDQKERAWYDSHKSSILRGGSCGAAAGGYQQQNEEDEDEDLLNLWPFFSEACFDSFNDDDPRGFWNIYESAFQQINNAERAAVFAKSGNSNTSTFRESPPFGNSHSVWSDVARFYAFWDAFSTKKAFSWHDKWNPNDAENRRVRRLIETENKKERDKHKREYNDTVHSLVNFVKRRDKRVIKEQDRRRREEDRLKAEQQAREQQRRLEHERIKAEELAQKRRLFADETSGDAHENGDFEGKKENDDDEVESLLDEAEMEALAIEDELDSYWETMEVLEAHARGKGKKLVVNSPSEEDLDAVDDETESAADRDASQPPLSATDEQSPGEDAEPASPAVSTTSSSSRQSKKKKKRRQQQPPSEQNHADDDAATPTTEDGSSSPSSAGMKSAKYVRTKSMPSHAEDVETEDVFPEMSMIRPKGGKKKKNKPLQPQSPTFPEAQVPRAKSDSALPKASRENDDNDEEEDLLRLYAAQSLQRPKGRAAMTATSTGEKQSAPTLPQQQQPDEPEIESEQAREEPQSQKKTRRSKKGKDSAAFLCNTCGVVFETRNKLFKHINETRHALAGKQ